MRFFPAKIRFLALTVGSFALALPAAHAADSPRSAEQTRNFNRDFAIVPAGDSLYQDLAALRTAGWIGDSSSATLSRYEIALETVKALLAVRAEQRGDAAKPVSVAALRSLRSLCQNLSAELVRFDVDAKSSLDEINGWLKAAEARADSGRPSPTFTLQPSRPGGMRPAFGTPTDALSLSLSQRLRVTAAATSLARAERDLFTPGNTSSLTSGFRLGARQDVAYGSFGAAYALNEWINLRGDVVQRPLSDSLASTLFGTTARTVSGDERTLGGGVDIAVRPGVMLRGDVSRYQSRGAGIGSLGQWSGTRYGTSLELSGWQNRVELSAQLSRLIPEDSYALASTAAQLNLGVGLSREVSLKLLYRQMFESPQSAPGNRIIAGGIDINF